MWFVTFVFFCLWNDYARAQTCSVTAASFETEFCTMKQEIEAVKQFDSRISSAEHELLTLKHTVQTETAELKNNQNVLQNIQTNITDLLSGGGHFDSNSTEELKQKMDKLLTMFKDLQDRLDHIEVKCQVCGNNGSSSGHPCDANPCQNSGKCLELSKDFQCVCASGFTGERCQFTDHCATAPCKNNGNCSSNILGHVCHCSVEFTGPYCEIKLNACDSNPCKHGTCIVDLSSYKCVCDTGYNGPNCETPSGPQGVMTTQTATNPTTATTAMPSTATHTDPCAKSSVCNEPATCKAVGPQDFICVCPETDRTTNDKCLKPYYYEQYGFCCAKNTCKNDEIVC